MSDGNNPVFPMHVNGTVGMTKRELAAIVILSRLADIKDPDTPNMKKLVKDAATMAWKYADALFDSQAKGSP